MNRLVRGYILKANVYKEADAIINLLDESGELITFKVRGMYKPNSKNNPSCQLFTKGEYVLDFKTDYSHKTLKSGVVLEQINLLEKIEPNIILGLLAEVIILVEDLMPTTRIAIFDYVFKSLKAGENYFLLVLMILKMVMMATGTQLEAFSCVNCGSKERIVTLSFEDGGYLCSSCNIKLNRPLRVKGYLILFKDLMRTNFSELNAIKVDDVEARALIKDLLNYLEHSMGFRFKSRPLIETAL
jgi:DNA repair protein RecO (recombination protein O)